MTEQKTSQEPTPQPPQNLWRRRSFFFAYLILFPLLLQLLFGAFSFSGEDWLNWTYSLFFRLLLAGVFTLPLLWLPRWGAVLFTAAGAVTAGLFNLLDIFLLVNFGSLFDWNIWKIISIAPPHEVSGFLQLFLFRFTTLLILLLYPAAGIIIFKVRKWRMLLSSLFLFTGAVLFFFNCSAAGKFIFTASPAERLKGFVQDWQSSKVRQEMAASALKITAAPYKKEALYVVVIGESHSKRRSSLYGFEVDNMPNLKELHRQKKIFRFDDAVTPHVMTHLAMPHLLTLSPVDEKNFFKVPSLPDIFRKAGFKVWYIYNQMPDSEKSLPFLAAAKRADHFISLSAEKKVFDGKVLEVFSQILNTPESAKVVFIHLLGNHWAYGKTFPPEFKTFRAPPGAGKKGQILADYDNSLLYLDHLLSQMIRLLEQRSRNSFLLYLPDHGEALYEEENFVGHTDLFPTAATAEIPMVLWLSEKYDRPEKKADIARGTKKPFISSDLPHLLMDLSGISTPLFIQERSILDPRYTPRRRTVSTKKADYDTMKGRFNPSATP